MDNTPKPVEVANNDARAKPAVWARMREHAVQPLPTLEWIKTPPEWIDAAIGVVAARLKRSTASPGDRAHTIARWVVWGGLALYAVVVLVCVVRVVYAMFSGSPDDINKLLLALGGVVGGPFLAWRTFIAHQQTGIAREGQYTSLFTKAVEQLGATREAKTYQDIDDGSGGKRRELVTTTEANLEVRLGAVYAFDRVARDSERDHWPVMQVLCAYVRNPQNSEPLPGRAEGVEYGSPEFLTWLHSVKSPRLDVQAALTVLGDRPEQRRKYEVKRALKLNFYNADLHAAILDGGHFEYANFDGACLDVATFFDAYLGDASFSKTRLAGAWFFSANVTGARFDDADLAGAHFNGSQIAGASFERANLAGASFCETDLSEALSLDSAALRMAHGDASTKLPAGIDRPAKWPDRKLSWSEQVIWFESGCVPSPKT